MIKTRISAVTSVTYGLLSALIIAVIAGGLSGVGIGAEKVFSAAGNGITTNAGNSTSTSTPVTSTPTPTPVTSTPTPTPAPNQNPLSTPNSTLLAFQQSQITNAAAEIAAGTASAACLQYMNNAANAASMASNNATCLGPGYGIAPPALPVAFEAGTYDDYAVEPNGLIYADLGEGSFSTTSAASSSVGSVIAYNDGEELTGFWSGSPSVFCGSDTVSIINNMETICNGARNTPLGTETKW